MLHMTDVEKSPLLSKNNVCYLWSFVAKYVFLQFTLFCREISFGTIYAILRGEKSIMWRQFRFLYMANVEKS